MTDEKTVEVALTRDAIENLGNKVRKVDEDDNCLELFCYTKCSNRDPELVRRCRGLVFHENRLIMHAFPYTLEFNHEETDKIDTTFGPCFSKCRFFDSYEGALIRLFNFKEKWYVSTHRKLDAFRSKWASYESFGEIFQHALEHETVRNSSLKSSLRKGENVIEQFTTTLNPEHQYMILIRNTPTNRIVCTPPSNNKEPRLFHVGTFMKDGSLNLDDSVGLSWPKEYKFLNQDELVDAVSNMSIRNLQGIVVFAPNNVQYKVLHKEYQDYFRVRGNEPSIKYRYLQVRMNQEMSMKLQQLYPSQMKVFQDYENCLYAIARSIYHVYEQRYKKHLFIRESCPLRFKVLKECHNWYCEDKDNNRVNVESVIEVMNKQSPTHLNKLIRNHKQALLKDEKEEGATSERNDKVVSNASRNSSGEKEDDKLGEEG